MEDTTVYDFDKMWEWEDVKEWDYICTKCGFELAIPHSPITNEFKFCPGCGRRILHVEEF